MTPFQMPKDEPETPKSTGQEYSEAYIRVRAYEIWQDRNATGEPGDALGDWLEAEGEMSLPG